MAHTPGPWHRWNVDPIVIHDVIGDRVATTSHEQPCRHADARLIAAAPQLLEALEAMLQSTIMARTDDDDEVFALCRNAIRAAKGE